MCLKNLVSIFIDWIYKMRLLRGSGTPVLYLECTEASLNQVCSVLLLCVSIVKQSGTCCPYCSRPSSHNSFIITYI